MAVEDRVLLHHKLQEQQQHNHNNQATLELMVLVIQAVMDKHSLGRLPAAVVVLAVLVETVLAAVLLM